LPPRHCSISTSGVIGGRGAAESTGIWPRFTRNLVSILAGGDVHQLQK
jgi:hypothetical protein